MAEKIYRKSYPSDADLLPDIEEWIMKLAEEANLNEDKYNNLALSVAEAASNCMVHGNNSDVTKELEIEVKYNDKTIDIKFKDQGKGFELSKVPDPTQPENILKDSGRGIHIMRSFLDDLTFNFTPSGTEIILTLNLS